MKFNKNPNVSQKFISLETLGARFLLLATLLALFISNSSLKNNYYYFFNSDIENFFYIKVNILFIINDIFMTIFFLVVGLEVKYEILKGSLNSFHKAILPGIGAIGGMLVPAGIYILCNYHDAFLLKGWAVPTATDIAFSLAILSFIGPRIPYELKAYLTALAIFDDIAAIIIIAFFYTSSITTIFLGFALICLIGLFILNRMAITYFWPYLLIGIILWFCLLRAGIHPTLTGVMVAAMIPTESKKKKTSLLQKVHQLLHPCVILFILPLFAFANAGISFFNLNKENLHLSIMLGVFFGLFFGKQIGIFGSSWLAVKYGFARLPNQMRWRELYAISIVCGIGFTISLFIGALAFNYNAIDYLNSIKIGVFAGSLLSGITGYLLLLIIFTKHRQV